MNSEVAIIAFGQELCLLLLVLLPLVILRSLGVASSAQNRSVKYHLRFRSQLAHILGHITANLYSLISRSCSSLVLRHPQVRVRSAIPRQILILNIHLYILAVQSLIISHLSILKRGVHASAIRRRLLGLHNEILLA